MPGDTGGGLDPEGWSPGGRWSCPLLPPAISHARRYWRRARGCRHGLVVLCQEAVGNRAESFLAAGRAQSWRVWRRAGISDVVFFCAACKAKRDFVVPIQMHEEV